MNVEVLYFDGCPSHEALLPRLRELMAQAGVDTPVQLTHIDSVQVAERQRFLGSPTLRIDGEDVDPTASERTDYGLKCRLYPSAEGLRGRVPDELVLAALTRARKPRGCAPAVTPAAPVDFDDWVPALRDVFPAREDAPLALALVRLLSAGQPVSEAALAQTTGRPEREVVERLDGWPNVQRDHQARIVGFSGLTLNTTAHSFRVGDRQLYTWCAWDTLLLPALLAQTARVRAKCAVTDRDVELVVSPSGIESAHPRELHVTFPPLAAVDTNNVTSSFCCHVVFLADADADAEAARTWEATHPGDTVVDVAAAYELGRRTIAPLLRPPAQMPSESGR